MMMMMKDGFGDDSLCFEWTDKYHGFVVKTCVLQCFGMDGCTKHVFYWRMILLYKSQLNSMLGVGLPW
jgi:hypothetical protein